MRGRNVDDEKSELGSPLTSKVPIKTPTKLRVTQKPILENESDDMMGSSLEVYEVQEVLRIFFTRGAKIPSIITAPIQTPMPTMLPSCERPGRLLKFKAKNAAAVVPAVQMIL